MSRYRAYFPTDEAALQDGDGGFVGVNMRIDPAQVGKGFASNAVNKRFNRGIAETRRGLVKVPWCNRVPSYNPAVNNGDVDPTNSGAVNYISPFTAPIYGVGTYTDPESTLEWMIIAAGDGAIYRSRESNMSAPIPLPVGTTITGPVTFTQANNVLLCFRGTELEELVMENFTEGFFLVSTMTVDSAPEMLAPNVDPIPYAESGEYFQNRLLVPVGDLVYVSDILDYTHYAPATGAYRIHQGSQDSLVRLIKFNETAVVCLKQKSIYLLSNLIPYASGNFEGASLELITDQYGCKAPKTAKRIGKDVWCLADRRGVISITQTEQNKVQAVDLPMSDAVQPLIDRINWDYADTAVAEDWNNRYYLAVPLDNAELKLATITPTGPVALVYTYATVEGERYYYAYATLDATFTNGTEIVDMTDTDNKANFYFTAQGSSVTITVVSGTSPGTIRRVLQGVNNAVLVYDRLNQAWSGYDYVDPVATSSTGLLIKDWVLHKYNGIYRLFTVSDDGFLSLYEEAFIDELATLAGVVLRVEIADELLTRGYTCATSEIKRFWRATVDLQTWKPTYTITSVVDGVRERTTNLTAETRSRTAYFAPFDAAPYVTTNAADNFFTPYREDYSWLPGASETTYLDGAGIDPDLHQQYPQSPRLNVFGQYCQVKITSATGRVNIRTISLEGNAGPRRGGIVA